METQDHTSQGPTPTTPQNIILFLCSWSLHALSAVTAEGIYTWMFRGLSLLSITLIIIINWSKAIKIIFKKKK